MTTPNEQMDEELAIKFNEALHRMYRLEILPHIQGLINERIPDDYTKMVFVMPDDLKEAIAQHTKEAERLARIDEVHRYYLFDPENTTAEFDALLDEHDGPYVAARLAELSAPQQSTSPDGSAE